MRGGIMENTDLRVIKSRKNIRLAFIELMKEKTYQAITVKDISEKAMINRKTFYFHYETKEDLYNEIANDVAKLIEPKKLLNEIQSSNIENQRKIMLHFVSGLKKHKEICTIFLDDVSNPKFSNMLKDQLTDALTLKIENYKSTKGSDFTFDFLLDAYYSIFKVVLKWWLASPCEDPNVPIEYFFRLFSKEPLDLLGIKY